MSKISFSAQNSATKNKNKSGELSHPERTGKDGALQDWSNKKLLLLAELRDMYGAEKHQWIILPLLKRSASSLKLQSVLAGHLYGTYDHINRLEQVFRLLRRRAQGHTTEAILGIARECEHVIGETPQGTATRDAGLILAARQLEHYEISAYGSLTQLARTLEYDDIADLLETTLNEEKDTDDLLLSLGENYIHPEASLE